MKFFSTLLFCLIAGLAQAQFSVGIKAGYNTTRPVAFKHTPDYYGQLNSSNGWQATLLVNRNLNHWFIYSGAGVTVNSFKINYSLLTEYGTTYHSFYHPLYVSVPLGAGYRFNLKKDFAIKLYGGVYGQIGTGGKVTVTTYPYCDPMACPELNTIAKNNIDYNSKSGNLAPLNAGIEGGTGLQVCKKLELLFLYHYGLTNVLSDVYNYKARLRTFEVNAKFNIVKK